MTEPPPDFLKTIASIQHFAETLMKLKRVADQGGKVTLRQEDCQALVWGLQVLKQGPQHD